MIDKVMEGLRHPQAIETLGNIPWIVGDAERAERIKMARGHGKPLIDRKRNVGRCQQGIYAVGRSAGSSEHDVRSRGGDMVE